MIAGPEGQISENYDEKSRIRKTKNLSTDVDIRTDTILERLRNLSNFFFFNERMSDFSF